MTNGNGSSLSSTHQQELATPAAGNLHGDLSGGAWSGGKPPRHPGRMKSVHELDGAAIPTVPVGGDEREPFRCSFYNSFFNGEEDLHRHIRRFHVHRSWRRGKEEAPRPPPFVTERYVFEKLPLLGGHQCRSSHTGKKSLSLPAKMQQETAPTKAPAAPAFYQNVPAPEVENEKRSSD